MTSGSRRAHRGGRVAVVAALTTAGSAGVAAVARLTPSAIGPPAKTPPPIGAASVYAVTRAASASVAAPGRATRAVPRAHATARTARVPLRRLVGQRFVVRWYGPVAAEWLVRRIRRGEVGGVVLFADNVSPRLRQQVQRLRGAAHEGGNPPLLVAIDQEGGRVKRLHGFPPSLAPRAMAGAGALLAESEGRRTGRALIRRGINVNLAPVADVPASRRSFLRARAFGRSPEVVASNVAAFARGLAESGVAATAKHFPGLGTSGAASTDRTPVVLWTGETELARRRRPFDRLIRDEVPLIMLSSAVYAAYDADRPAVLSPRIANGLLRERLGFTGVTSSDALDTPALARFGSHVARLATLAGVDLLLYAKSDGRAGYRRLLADARGGRVSARVLERSYFRVRRLKLTAGVPAPE